MSNFAREFQNWNKSFDSNKKRFKQLYKQKSDILLLRKKLNDQNVEWPIRSPKSSSNKVSYTTDTLTLSKSKEKRRYIIRPFDPLFSNEKARSQDRHAGRKSAHEECSDSMNEFIDHVLSRQLKPKPTTEMDGNTAGFIKDTSLDVLDKLLVNIANSQSRKDDSEEEQEGRMEGRVGLDWEFIMGNLIQTGLPTPVIDRVKRKMALITGKNTPAITAMTVTPPSLSDLTITTAELDMKKAIQDLIKKNEIYQSRQKDEAFENDVKWLINLNRKDPDARDKEIEKINQDYTNRVLDLKPAFF